MTLEMTVSPNRMFKTEQEIESTVVLIMTMRSIPGPLNLNTARWRENSSNRVTLSSIA